MCQPSCAYDDVGRAHGSGDLRRVGREHETRISGTQLRDIVGALHAMFMVHVRADHMAGVQRLAKGMPSGAEMVELLVPGTAPVASREDLK